MCIVSRGLARPSKPWLIPSATWKQTANFNLFELSKETRFAIAVAKPSENIYLAASDGLGAILNLASHGEMAVSRLIDGKNGVLSPLVTRLVNILPTQVEVNGTKIGEKKGKFLNHFGYRKEIMNLVPESIADHAWIACALSYSTRIPDSMPDKWMFDPKGGWITDGVAGTTDDGLVFRGSGVEDAIGVIATAELSLETSLQANAKSMDDVFELVSCTVNDFVNHRFYSKLASLVRSG